MKTISQPTRSAARKLAQDLKSSGKQCKLIDNGNMFQGSQRWSVQVEVLQGTLKAPVKPSHSLFGNLTQSVCNKAITAQNYLQRVSGGVQVVYKRKLHNV